MIVCCAEARAEAATDTIILEMSMLTRGMQHQGVNKQSIWTIYVNARLQLLHLDTLHYWINGQNLRVSLFVWFETPHICGLMTNWLLIFYISTIVAPVAIVVLWHSRAGHHPPYNGTVRVRNTVTVTVPLLILLGPVILRCTAASTRIRPYVYGGIWPSIRLYGRYYWWARLSADTR